MVTAWLVGMYAGDKRENIWQGYSREILVDIFCWLLEETFKLIPSPLQTKQRDYMGLKDKMGFCRH